MLNTNLVSLYIASGLKSTSNSDDATFFPLTDVEVFDARGFLFVARNLWQDLESCVFADITVR